MAGLPLPIPGSLVPRCNAAENAGAGVEARPSGQVSRWLDEQRRRDWDGDPAYLTLIQQTSISDVWAGDHLDLYHFGAFRKNGRANDMRDPASNRRLPPLGGVKFDLRVEAQSRYDLLMTLVDRYNASAKTISGKKFQNQFALMEGCISWEVFNRNRSEISAEMVALFDGPSLYVKAIDMAEDYPWISRRLPREYPSLDKINDGLGAAMNKLGGWKSFMDQEHKARKARF